MDADLPNQVSLFYGWWQLSVSLFAFLSLMSIWYHIGKKQADYGPVWLALSVLCWAFSGLVDVIYLYSDGSYVHYKDGFRSVFSLTNSLFILMALPWFKYLPKQFAPLIKSKFWPYIIGIPFFFALFPTLFKMFLAQEASVINELDVVYAFLTLIFLGFVLWESFRKRRLPLLAWLALITILVTLLAQIYKLTGSNINLLLFSAIFKTSLIMLFFALALSWVKELTETVIPEPHLLKLVFGKPNKRSSGNGTSVTLLGFPGEKDRTVQLTPALYNLLKTFAERKKNTNEGWLEIKPKNFIASKNYDINDHNELKRLLESILNGLFGKGNWTKEKHYEPLKTSLFQMSENRERKIRLHLPKENITIEN
ncbi:hypothetical protein [Flagellimonas crocea]|uniref:hypothetical protein n=1 Tax=Flagellimonas crocea TaxID=3067311 RepID=UPI00296FA545|nr:hypothetical protein [Muricauda sp. DH64]